MRSCHCLHHMRAVPFMAHWTLHPHICAHDCRRVKSGKEVRDFLRRLGISLDSGAAVIKQVGAAWRLARPGM